MLTRSRKKRTAGEDESCPKKQNQKSSTIPGNHAVEVGEMVTMNHGGTSGGLDDGCQRTDYLQVAWLLREKLNDLVDGDQGEIPGLELRSLLDMASSGNIVSVDPKMLNPILWRTLPKELLLLVLARLPLADITRLRCLSREWRRDMATVNSDINRSCHEASPPMVALLSHSPIDAFLVTIYDIQKCRWQCAYHLHLPSPWNDALRRSHPAWAVVDACDGGLVCFLLLTKPTKRNANGLCIVVVNLLTRVQHQLPPVTYRYYTLPLMVKIKVDLDTKCYKVFVASYVQGRLAVEIYDSATRQWTRGAPPCGSIFGHVQNWTNCGMSGWCHKLSPTPGAYDFAEGKLELYSKIPSIGGSVTGSLLLDSVLKKDRMFVLLEQTRMDASSRRRVHHGCCITEYHVENQTKDWVQGKSYECPSVEEFLVDLSAMCLNACDGFLIIIVHRGQRSQCFWLLDLSTSEWKKLPESSKELHTEKSVLCRALWNVIP